MSARYPAPSTSLPTARLTPESVLAFDRNWCPPSTGIAARLAPESVPGFDRISQTDRNARSEALAAVHLFQKIIAVQFAAFGQCPWFISDSPGISFVRQDHVHVPFVRRVVLPSCYLVGPAHQLRSLPDGRWEVLDDHPYPGEEIADAEFIRRFVEAQERAVRTAAK